MFVIVYDKAVVLWSWAPGRCKVLSKEAFTQSQMISTLGLAPLHHGCVTLGKALNFSEPKFSLL